MPQERMTVEQYRMEMGLEPVKMTLPLKRSAKNDKESVRKSKIDPGAKQRPSKYGAKKTCVDGVWFDSKSEADYYCGLKLQMQAGLIDGFCLQPEFILQDGDGTTIRYRADFIAWYPDGRTDVVDTKGVKTPEFKIKAKLFRVRFPKLNLVVVES